MGTGLTERLPSSIETSAGPALFGVGSVLDGFKLLFGDTDRHVALCVGETHKVGGGENLTGHRRFR